MVLPSATSRAHPSLATLDSGLFFIAFLLPTFFSLLGSSGAILLNLLIMIFIGLRLVFGSIHGSARYHRVVLFVGLICLLMFAHTSLAAVLSHASELIERDVFELHRPLYIFLVFLLPALIDPEDPESLFLRLRYVLLILFVFLLVVGFLQLFGMAREFLGLYSKSQNLRSRRISVPFANPYDYAFIMAFFFFYFVHRALETKIFWNGLAATLALGAIIFTQSRSMLGALAVTFVLFLLPVSYRRDIRQFFAGRLTSTLRRILSMVLLLAALVTGLLVLFADQLGYLQAGFQRVFTGERLNSLALRADQITFSLQSANDSLIVFLIGNGPAKSIMEFVESLYAYYFFRYGVIGFLAYFVLPWGGLVWATGRCLLRWNEQTSPEMSRLLRTYLLWLLFVPLAGIGNNSTEQIRLSFFYYYWAGLIVFLLMSEYKISRSQGGAL